MEHWTTIFRFVSAAASAIIVPFIIIGALFGAISSYRNYIISKKKLLLLENEQTRLFAGQFNDEEIRNALSGYVIPHCSPADPANRDGEEFLADTRENLFEYLDRNIENLTKSYHIILADTGMGKTAFCMNFYVHLKKRFSDYSISLISLSSGDCLERIKAIPNKSTCVLIADALDEDPNAQDRGRERLSEIITSGADFRSVIITCRSQYFLSDDNIPRETPLNKLDASKNSGL